MLVLGIRFICTIEVDEKVVPTAKRQDFLKSISDLQGEDWSLFPIKKSGIFKFLENSECKSNPLVTNVINEVWTDIVRNKYGIIGEKLIDCQNK